MKVNQTRLSALPEHWEIKTIAEASEIPVSNGLYKQQDCYGKGPRMIHMTEVFAHDFISDQSMPHVALNDRELGKYLLEDGDLVFARRSLKPEGAGDVALVSPTGDMSFESSIIRARLKKHIFPRFVFEYLKSSYGKAQMMTLVRQVAVSGITGEDLKKYQIPSPPLPEQKKIAQILSTWDQAITATERLLENSQQRKKGLMQQLLTGKKRLPGFEGEWEEGHLKDITDISKGRALSSKDLEDGDYPVIAGGKTSPYTHKSYTHDHAITVSASGAYAGYIAYHEYKFWASDCSVVQATEASSIEFLYHLMTWNQTRIYSLQSGGAQPHVYPKDLHAIRVEIPEKEEQEAIAKVLTTADREINSLRCRLYCLKQEKKALMQQLLTGKRRVQVDTEAA